MDQDQLRQEIEKVALEIDFSQYSSDVRAFYMKDLTNLAVRLAREARIDEVTKMTKAMPYFAMDRKPFASFKKVAQDRLATLGEPEKTCDCKNWIRGKNCTEYHGGSPQ